MIHSHQIGPYEAQARAAKTAVQQRIWSPQRVPRKCDGANGTVRVIRFRREREWTTQADQHVRDWREHMKLAHEQPVHFIKRRCAELGISYEEIIGAGRQHRLIEPRHQLIADVHAKFKLSLPHIGRLFGGRDHTSVLFAVKKMAGERATRQRRIVPRDRIVSLYNAGFSQKDIAVRAGCAASVVSSVLDEEFPNRPKKRKISDSSAEVKALFEAGEIYAEIGHQLGFDPSAVSKFISKQGWTR